MTAKPWALNWMVAAPLLPNTATVRLLLTLAVRMTTSSVAAAGVLMLMAPLAFWSMKAIQLLLQVPSQLVPLELPQTVTVRRYPMASMRAALSTPTMALTCDTMRLFAMKVVRPGTPR